ncbi:MAG: hypothetical protein JWN78_1946 [Bacteroidota bacterium]|nr:hypothetical protein [Bacteroidota bacterium]
MESSVPLQAVGTISNPYENISSIYFYFFSVYYFTKCIRKNVGGFHGNLCHGKVYARF